MHALFAHAPEAWYVVQTKRGQECRARDHLQRQGFRCVLPLVQVERIHRRTRVWAVEPLFARYLFIELGNAAANWSVLRSTRGVSQLVSFGGLPAKLPPGCIDAFQRQATEPKRLFERGQRVSVTRGPFAGVEGIYQMPDGESRAMVLLELLGKPCMGAFAIDALRRVE
jgi:transcriptional antiterminator RfaH